MSFIDFSEINDEDSPINRIARKIGKMSFNPMKGCPALIVIALLTCSVQYTDLIRQQYQIDPCQDFEKITISTANVTEVVIRKDQVVTSHKNATSKVCFVPANERSNRGMLIQVKDTNEWSSIEDCLTNVPKSDVTRKDPLFSVNNTGDFGAWSLNSTAYKMLFQSSIKGKFKYPHPYNNLVNKDTPIARQRATQAIIVDATKMSASSDTVTLKVIGEQWTFTRFWQLFILCNFLVCLLAYTIGFTDGLALGTFNKRKKDLKTHIGKLTELYDMVKDVVYLFSMQHTFGSTIVLVSSIVVPTLFLLKMGCPFTDIYGIGNFNRTSNAGAVFVMKVLENIPQMYIQQMEMFLRGNRVTFLVGLNLIFGSAMLSKTIGYMTGYIIRDCLNTNKSWQLIACAFVIQNSPLVVLMILQWYTQSTYFVSETEANQNLVSFTHDVKETTMSYLWVFLFILICVVPILIYGKYNYTTKRADLKKNPEKYEDPNGKSPEFEGGNNDDDYQKLVGKD